MSNIQKGGEWTSVEIAMITGLNNLGISSATQAIQKTGTTTFANVELNVSGAIWGQLTGTLSNQTDLQDALNLKFNTANFNLSTFDTADLAEGTNLYYTQARFDTAFGLKTTANLADSLNKRYVTDAHLTILGNTSGTNSGDNAVNTLYSGLATSKQDALSGTGFVKISGTTISYDNSTYLTSISGLDHGLLGGLTDDDHTQYALLAGRSGGQTLIGGTASGNDLTLQSTSHGTKGNIFFGTSTYDEVNNRLGIGVQAPDSAFHVYGSDFFSTSMFFERTGAGVDDFAGINFLRTNDAGDGDKLGYLSWRRRGTTGSLGLIGAFIRADINGTPSDTALPMDLKFFTAGAGALLNNSSTPRMTIASTGNVGIGVTPASTLLEVGTYNGTQDTFRTGAFAIQPVSISNGFLANNAYYNGSSMTRTGTGYASYLQFFNGQVLLNTVDTGTGNFTPTLPLKAGFTDSGTVALGGNISSTSGTYTGATMVVLGTGKVGIGTVSPQSKLDVEGNVAIGATYSGTTAAPTNGLLVEGVGYFGLSSPITTGASVVALNSVEAQRFDDAASNAPNMAFTRSRGTEGSKTAVVNGSEIGRFLFRGYDGTTPLSSARFGAIVDGAVSTGVVPQALTFSTGSSGTPSEVMRIDSSGNVGIGTSSATVNLDVRGANSAIKIGTGTTRLLGASQTGIGIDNGTEKFLLVAQSGGGFFGTASNHDFGFIANNSTKMTVTTAGNFKIAGTATRATTEGTNHLDIFNGTAPVGTLANGISIYSSAGECYIMDAAGNATLQSPHDKEGNWIYKSTHTPTGKVLKIDMEKMMKAINDKFGWDFVKEYTI